MVCRLYTQIGLISKSTAPVCVYRRHTFLPTFGMLYYAEIRKFEKELHSEIEKIQITDQQPDEWTYPEIQPVLIEI